MPELELEEATILPPELASHYETNDGIIKAKGPEAARASLEMWSALLDIAHRRSWRARYRSQNEWIAYLTELNIYGLSRANIMAKIGTMNDLINAAATPGMAMVAAAAIPKAASELDTPEKMRTAAKELTPDEYLQELVVLPSPGQAVRRVLEDRGHSVSMWVQDVAVSPSMAGGVSVILLKIVREDSTGYTSFDVRVSIQPANEEVSRKGVAEWLASRLKGLR